MEALAVEFAFGQFRQGTHVRVISEAIEEEIERRPDARRRGTVRALLAGAQERLGLDDKAIALAHRFSAEGVGVMDAVHLAVAKAGKCDILLTTDDQFLRRARMLNAPLQVRVKNPVEWALEVTGP